MSAQSTPPDPPLGLVCPHPDCRCGHFRTTNTIRLPDGRIKRRKVCRNCQDNGRVTVVYTFEIPSSAYHRQGF